jgi:hypothetical protein
MSEQRRLVDDDERFATLVSRFREGTGPQESFEKLLAALERGEAPKVDPDRSSRRSAGLRVGVGIVGALALGMFLSAGVDEPRAWQDARSASPPNMVTSAEPSSRANAPVNGPPATMADAPSDTDVPSFGVRDLPSRAASVPGRPSAVRSSVPARPSAPRAGSVGLSVAGGPNTGGTTDSMTENRPEARSPSTLRRELELIQRARSTLAAGDGSRCLVVLDEYAREFPSGQFAVETRVLRIEALARIGGRAQARRVAEAVLAAQGRSP